MNRFVRHSKPFNLISSHPPPTFTNLPVPSPLVLSNLNSFHRNCVSLDSQHAGGRTTSSSSSWLAGRPWFVIVPTSFCRLSFATDLVSLYYLSSKSNSLPLIWFGSEWGGGTAAAAAATRNPHHSILAPKQPNSTRAEWVANEQTPIAPPAPPPGWIVACCLATQWRHALLLCLARREGEFYNENNMETAQNHKYTSAWHNIFHINLY